MTAELDAIGMAMILIGVAIAYLWALFKPGACIVAWCLTALVALDIEQPRLILIPVAVYAVAGAVTAVVALAWWAIGRLGLAEAP